MEGIHGVDVSWLHRSTKDQQRGVLPLSPALKRDPKPPTTDGPSDPATEASAILRPQQAQLPQSPTADGKPRTPSQTYDPQNPPRRHRPSVLGRAASDKHSPFPSPQQDSPKQPRRNSWITNLSSKFGPSSPHSPHTARKTPPQSPQPLESPGVNPFFTNVNPFDNTAPVKKNVAGTAGQNAQKEPVENLEPYCPLPPKGTSGNFFSALRRLSTGGAHGTSQGGSAMNGGMVARKVLNVDKNRHRCSIKELDQKKLRRVAFCVDVEITGGPRYNDETEDPDEKEKKRKQNKLKEKGEGAALKDPEGVALPKQLSGYNEQSGEHVGTEDNPNPEGTVPDTDAKTKQRTEAEERQKREKKTRKAQESGAIPVEIAPASTESLPGRTPPSSSAPKQTMPTTDPLRIYRRCCQLRESPVLKRISEQLAATSNSPDAVPGVVPRLDLTGSRMQLSDADTLGDWLAIVPVRTLILEDSDLSDEGLRVILAGLLNAKVPQPTKRKRGTSSPKSRGSEQQSGTIEKVVLKNNPRLSREGWKYIGLFIHMSKSLKAIDISMNPFPTPASKRANGLLAPDDPGPKKKDPASVDMSEVLFKAVSEREGGSQLEELIMAEVGGLSAEQLRRIVDAAVVCGIKRLGLAGNSIDREGLQQIARYLRSGFCEGLDLAGNDMSDKMDILTSAIAPKDPLWALSVAECNLTAPLLDSLFSALVQLPNFRFIDLSRNRDLFATRPSALSVLRKYLTRFPILKRVHLADVSISPEEAIGLIEILPECKALAHLNLLENPQLSALAHATDEAGQEDACALYASLMAAARASKTLICVDIDVPSPEMNEIVKALAKQVVAYCLRNVEQFTAEAAKSADAAAILTDPYGGEKEVAIPDVLTHLLGNPEGFSSGQDGNESAPGEDYIVGGSGVVKALSYVLGGKGMAELKRSSSQPGSGTVTPRTGEGAGAFEKGKAKEMSKDLLNSARKVRARLQPVLVKTERGGDDMALKRLQFLDRTLDNIIHRFEDEYPECRQGATATAQAAVPGSPSTASLASLSMSTEGPSENEKVVGVVQPSTTAAAAADTTTIEPTDPSTATSRRASGTHSAAAAQMLEEAQMHRLGQRVRRDILPPQTQDYQHGVTGHEGPEPRHLIALREKLEGLGGEEIAGMVREKGWERVAKEMGADAEALRQMYEVGDWRAEDKAVEAAGVSVRHLE